MADQQAGFGRCEVGLHFSSATFDVTLISHSPVFRDMFASKLNNSGNEIKISDVNSDDLKTFLDVITAKRLSSSDRNVPRAQKVIPLLLRFDMVHLAKPFLYQCVLNLSPNYIYEAFVLASQLDDLDSGLRILTQGHVWYHGTGKHSAPSLCPGSVKRPWTRGDADQVRSGWMWALSHATENVDTRRATTAGIEPDKPAYWLLVAGEFVGYIHR